MMKEVLPSDRCSADSGQTDRHVHPVRESWGHMTTCSHRDRSTLVGLELAGAGES